MRNPARLAGAAGAALAAVLIQGLSGCAAPQYRYVSSDNRDLVMRVPRTWSPVDTKAALKATGSDPATWTGWAAFYDGSAKPTVEHLKTPSASDPMMSAQTITVPTAQRASITGDQLLELILPSTPQVREQATKAGDFAILSRQNVSTKRESGVHVTYSFKIGTGRELFDRIALIDPKHTAVHVVFVHCTQQCFRDHPEIDDVVSSLTLKSP